MPEGPKTYFKPAISADRLHRRIFRQSVFVAALFTVPAIAVMVYWALNGWPDFVRGTVAIIPPCAIIAGLWSVWKPWSNWWSRPIIRTYTLEGGVLFQTETATRNRKIIRETDVPLGAGTVALVRSGILMLRCTGGKQLRLITISAEEFADENAHEGFIRYLQGSGVEFSDSLKPILFGPKSKAPFKKNPD